MTPKKFLSLALITNFALCTPSFAQMGAGKTAPTPPPSANGATGNPDAVGLPRCAAPLGTATVERRSQSPAVWNALDMFKMNDVIEAMLDTSGCFTVVKDQGQADYKILAIAVPPNFHDNRPTQIGLAEITQAIKTVEASGYVMRSKGKLGAPTKIRIPRTVNLNGAEKFDKKRVAALVHVVDLRTGYVAQSQTAIATSKDFDHKALSQRYMQQRSRGSIRSGRGALYEGYGRRIANAISAAMTQTVAAMRTSGAGSDIIDATIRPRDLGIAQRDNKPVVDYDPKTVAADFKSTNAVRRKRVISKYKETYGRVSGYVLSLEEAQKNLPEDTGNVFMDSFSMSFADLSTKYLLSITPDAFASGANTTHKPNFICQVRRDTVRERTPDKLTGDDRPIPAYSDSLLDRLAALETGDRVTVVGQITSPFNEMFQISDCTIE